MGTKKETYAQAMDRLENIVRQIDNEIIAFCTEKLKKTDLEVEKIWQEKQKYE